MQDKFKVSMPHRHTIVYESNQMEISFEVELLSDGIVIYTNSPKFTKGDKKEISQETSEVIEWLKNKFSKVEIDDSPPVIFNI